MADLTETLKQFGVHTYPIDVPVDAGLRRELDFLLHAIERQIENDWGCTDDLCTAENPLCDHMNLVVAKNRLLKILTPIHRSVNPDRLGNPAEDIYLRRWQKEQERHSPVNHGFGLLELLLTPTRVRVPSFLGMSAPPYYVPPVSQRDAEVAASVIQWLGTTCGRGFIEAAEREIKTAKAERRDVDHERSQNIWKKERILPHHENLARESVMRFIRADDPKFDDAVKVVIAAIQASHVGSEVPGAC